jgi:hypothetical protein
LRYSVVNYRSIKTQFVSPSAPSPPTARMGANPWKGGFPNA